MNTTSQYKDIILSHTTTENIYIKFLGLTTFPKGNISSPFTKDENASFKLYKNGSFKCNSSGKQGDAFQFVADLKQLDCKTKFIDVCKIIATDMNINLQDNCNSTQKQAKTSHKTANYSIVDVATDLQPNCNDTNEIVATMQNIPFKVNVTARPFTKYDLDYWQIIGVSSEILNRYNVLSVAKYQFFSTAKNKNFSFEIAPDKLCFAYQINENFEVYVPAQPEHKQNKIFVNGLVHSDIFGLDQIHGQQGENIIICAGKKDTLTLASRGFKAVTFRSETHHPTAQQIETLQRFCTNLFICYDNDNGGTTGRNNIVKKYKNIIPLQLPENKNIKGYDITDYFQEHTTQDFQKIIDLAVKNKNVVEVVQSNKYSQYELPKEVSEPIENLINDIENYSMFMANNRIWIMQGDVKKYYFKSVSNFEIEILQHMQDELRPLKLVRIKNVRNMECVFDVQSNQINTLPNFDTTMTNFSNFYFTGTKKDFDILRAFLYDKMGNGRKIDSLGYQKEFNIWIWNNKVNLFNGTEIDIDKNGMFTLNENCFYIPSANQIYKNNNSRYMSQKKFKIHSSKIKISEYLRLINMVYAENSISAILFSIASLFQDIVVSETNSFPILFLQGQKSSGKDNLAFCCQSFLGTPQDKISIGAGISTPKAQIRELAQFINGISHFSEYKTGDRITDEILKSIWDRNGYKIATIESKISSDIIPVLNSLILTSNYTPIDEALISRLIWVNIEKNSGFTDKNINDFDQLNDISKNGVSSLSNDLFIYRNDFQLHFKEIYRKNKKLLTNLFGNAPVRIAGNYAVLYSIFEFFSPYIEFPFTENEMKTYFMKSSDYMDNKMKTSNIVSRWWECFYECLTALYENKIILDQDFKINTNQIIYNFTSIYGKIQRVWFNQYREHIPLKSTMQDALQKCNSFTEKKESVRIYKNPTTAYQFDLIKVPNGHDIIERIGMITAL